MDPVLSAVQYLCLSMPRVGERGPGGGPGGGPGQTRGLIIKTHVGLSRLLLLGCPHTLFECRREARVGCVCHWGGVRGGGGGAFRRL